MNLLTVAKLLAIQAQNSNLQSHQDHKNQLSNLFPLLLERVVSDKINQLGKSSAEKEMLDSVADSIQCRSRCGG
ncbi:MAG: hypothetical protein FH758_11595 [Firmicutes bacterium]|nr:hypothetical protein [Bacillota bacterium]